MILDGKVPAGPLPQKWDLHKFENKLVNPANKRKYSVIVVGSGLAGAAAAASLAELGYQVKCFCYQDSPRLRALHRRARRHQRREKLSKRRRQRGPPFLRHHQGRRFSLARSQRLSPGAAKRQHHRSVRGAGRALRARIRRPFSQSFLRRFFGVAHVLRAGTNRTTAFIGRLPGALATDRFRRGRHDPALGDAGYCDDQTAKRGALSPVIW